MNIRSTGRRPGPASVPQRDRTSHLFPLCVRKTPAGLPSPPVGDLAFIGRSERLRGGSHHQVISLHSHLFMKYKEPSVKAERRRITHYSRVPSESSPSRSPSTSLIEPENNDTHVTLTSLEKKKKRPRTHVTCVHHSPLRPFFCLDACRVKRDNKVTETPNSTATAVQL